MNDDLLTRLRALEAAGVSAAGEAAAEIERLRLPTIPEGWTRWGGGECPVAEDVKVEVRFRNGTHGADRAARAWRWFHHDVAGDIIAYRVVEPAPKPLTDAEWVVREFGWREGMAYEFTTGSCVFLHLTSENDPDGPVRLVLDHPSTEGVLMRLLMARAPGFAAIHYPTAPPELRWSIMGLPIAKVDAPTLGEALAKALRAVCS